MVGQEVDEGLVGLEQALDFGQFGGIVMLAEILGLLRQVLPLYGRVPLVGDDVRGGVVQGRYQ